MLVLTRKPGEKIVIDGQITITLLSSEAGRARIGIDAPDDVRILREELLDPQEDLAEETPNEQLYSAELAGSF
jgi:carbon storage regulator